MAKKKPGKKPTRGSGVSVTLPTEPLAGNAKTTPIMAVMVQDDGTPILEYEIKEGQSIQFRVGGTVRAFMERLGPGPGRRYVPGRRQCSNVEPVAVFRIRARAVRPAGSFNAAGATSEHQPRGVPALANVSSELGVQSWAFGRLVFTDSSSIAKSACTVKCNITFAVIQTTF